MSLRYDTAIVCINGHMINSQAGTFPVSNSPFCPECGAAAVACCGNCQTPIRGKFYSSKFITADKHGEVPLFCLQCGKMYPWTEARRNAAIDLFCEETMPDAEAKASFVNDIDAIIGNTPAASPGAIRIRNAVGNMTELGKGLLKESLSTVVKEGIKKILFGS